MRDAPSTLRRRVLAVWVGIYLLYSSFGIGHPVLWGHYGFHTAAYLLRALNTLRFGLVVPADSAGYAPPPPVAIYLHHPFAYHHLYTLLLAIFGNHAWLGAVAPVLTGLILMRSLYVLVRAFWGPWAATLAVVAWVSLPFVWTFSILTDPMFPAMTCSVVTTYAFLRYVEQPSARWLWVGALATGIGGILMWEALIQTALYGAVSLVWLIWKPRARIGRIRAGFVWIVVTGVVIAMAMGLHLAFILTHGRLEDFLTSFRVRREIGTLEAIGKNGVWSLILYGPVVEALFVSWFALFVVRVFRRKTRLRDLGVGTFFVINAIYILLFPQASAVHLYRVFWMSTSFVLAAVDLAVSLHDWIAARRLAGRAGRSPVAITVVVIGVVLLLVLPQSVYDLIDARTVMGCLHNDGYDPEEEKMRFADEASRASTPLDVIGITSSIDYRDEFSYRLDRTARDLDSLYAVNKPENADLAFVLTDANPPEGERYELTRLLAHHPARRISQWLMIDLRARGSSLRTFVFKPREPSLLWRWFVSHKYKPLDLVEETPPARAER